MAGLKFSTFSGGAKDKVCQSLFACSRLNSTFLEQNILINKLDFIGVLK